VEKNRPFVFEGLADIVQVCKDIETITFLEQVDVTVVLIQESSEQQEQGLGSSCGFLFFSVFVNPFSDHFFKKYFDFGPKMV